MDATLQPVACPIAHNPATRMGPIEPRAFPRCTLAPWRPPHRISHRLAARLLRLPLKGGNRRACVDVLVGKVAGIGWPPHRISLRLRLGFCDSPSRGE